MRGMVGEFRFDGRRAGEISLQREHVGSDIQVAWHSPEGHVAFRRWGQPCAFSDIDWHEVEGAGVVVIADCTLYERQQLANALGISVRDGSAAELLAQAYLHWGEDMLARLDGDFAFVICDSVNRVVFAATDPMGMRPLYFRYTAGESFVFSTSQDILAAWAGLDARIPISRLLESLVDLEPLAYIQPVIPGVERLPASHACRVTSDRVVHWRYWTPYERSPGLRENDVGGWVEGLRWRMTEAVRKRMADGVRMGVMFSGGLDSSVVLALACAQTPAGDITAYSMLDRSNLACAETLAIDRMVAATHATPLQIDLADVEADAQAARDALAGASGFLSGRAGFLLLLCQRAAASGVHVLMNGSDADALFYFHDHLERVVQSGRFNHAMRDARKLDRLLGGNFYEAKVRRLRVLTMIPSRPRRMLSALRYRVNGSKFVQVIPLSAEVIRQHHLQRRASELLQLQQKPNPGKPQLPISRMDELGTIDGVWRIRSRIHESGGELRCPFLDRELMEFAAWIPLELRLRHGRHKWILRKAMNPYLPHAVAWRGDKSHLGTDFDRAMLAPVLQKVIRDLRTDGPAIAPYVDRDRFLHEAARWKEGSMEASARLVPLLLLEHWLQHNHDKVRFDQ